VLCEIASRVGGAGIRYAIEAQFEMLLDEIWVQAQCNDPIKCSTLDVNWENRNPRHPSVGWIIIYPQCGKLVKRPGKDEAATLDYVLQYFPIASLGSVYDSATHSADAVAQFIVKGNSEEETQENLIKAFEWFNNASKWDPL